MRTPGAARALKAIAWLRAVIFPAPRLPKALYGLSSSLLAPLFPPASAPLLSQPWLALRLSSPKWHKPSCPSLWAAPSFLPTLYLPPRPRQLTSAEVLDYGFFFPLKPTAISAPHTPAAAKKRLAPLSSPLGSSPLRSSLPGPASWAPVRLVSPRRAWAGGFSSDASHFVGAAHAASSTRPPLSLNLERAVNHWRNFAPARQGTGASARPLPPRLLRSPIPQARLRPGLLTQWREARWDYVHTRALKLYRQKRISDYVTLTKTLTGFSYVRHIALSVGALTQASGLGLRPLEVALLWHDVRAGCWLLNGAHVCNPFLQVYRGDVLLLSSPHKSLPTLSWGVSWDRRRNLTRPGLAYATKWPRPSSTPWYLEVDELTQTVVMCAEPSSWQDFSPSLWRQFPFLTHRLLNWKYIT